MALTRLTAIAGDTILPLEQAKEHLRVRHSDEDTLIGTLRDAACEYIERISAVALAEADYRWEGSSFSRVSNIPVRPVTVLGEITYHDSDGEAATYTGARLINGSVYPAVNESWPACYGYASVTFTAGGDCPPDLLAAVKLMLGHFYSNREAVNVGNIVTDLPLGVDALVQTYRRVEV